MCAQFMIRANLDKLSKIYRAKPLKSFEWKAHVFPRAICPTIVQSKTQSERLVVPMQFALIPFFEKNEKPKKVFHNARVETIDEKITFKKAFHETRCLVPMDSFFEHIWTDDKHHWLARFSAQEGELLTAAGIWSRWKSPLGKLIHSFSIITTEPTPFIRETGHDRMPLFLSPEAFDEWLIPETKSSEELGKVLKFTLKPKLNVEKVEK